MSQLRWTSLDPLRIEGNELVIGRGDWAQIDGTRPVQDPPPKWLPVIVIDGGIAINQRPQMPSCPASTTFHGETPWDQQYRMSLGPEADGKEHLLQVEIYAAQYFHGWGDHPEDAWEWSNLGAKDESAAVLMMTFTLGATAPPPPPVSSPLPPELKTMVDNVNAEIAKEKAHDAINLINANKLAFSKLTLQLAKQALGQSPEPLAFPEAAHALRAASGLLQESAIAHRLAKP